MTTKTTGTTEICKSPESEVRYVKCTSSGPFVMPDFSASEKKDSKQQTSENGGRRQNTQAPPPPLPHDGPAILNAAARRVNQTLNLHLGLSFLNPRQKSVGMLLLLKSCRLLSRLLSLVEKYGMMVWVAVPLRIRHLVTMMGWRWYYQVHRRLLWRRTGIHRDVSMEYHALTTLAWWGNLFPVTLRRIRFFLNQIMVVHPPSSNISVKEDLDSDGNRLGLYLQLDPQEPSDRLLFWIYGGAFLSGDCDGNLGLAEKVARTCRADVFLAHYRLLPEHEFDEALDDVCRAYEHMNNCYNCSSGAAASSQKPPRQTIVFGISSGGGLALRLLQRAAAASASPITGCALMCPFVDYTEPTGSFAEYYRHDLVVNTSVVDMGVPYLASKLGSAQNRRDASPLYGEFVESKMPPLCVVASEHECMYDQNVALVNRARDAGVECTFGVWKYVCHVFPAFSPFVPEGRQALDFMCDWMKTRFEKSLD